MKLNAVLGGLLSVLALSILVIIVFLPIRTFAQYMTTVFGFILIILPFYLVIEAYYFIKDTPKRKEGLLSGQSKSKNRRIVEWGGVIIILLLLVASKGGYILNNNCPELIEGNEESEVRLLYFFDPFCPRCWGQELVVQEVVKAYGDRLRVERYDYRFCKDDWRKSGSNLMPDMVLIDGNSTQYLGTSDYDKISQAICKYTACDGEAQ